MQKLCGSITKPGHCFVALLLLAHALIGISRPVHAAGTITEFPLLGRPWDITSGPDGNLWFTAGSLVGRITPAGATTEFKFDRLTQNSITTGPDGNLWFTESGSDKVGAIIPSIATFLVPVNLPNGSQPVGIATGPDGNLWITDAGANKISRMTTGGHVLSEFTLPTTGSSPQGIVAGPDGRLWFTENASDRIGRISITGTLQETQLAAGSGPQEIIARNDGNLWFTEGGNNRIGRITPAGVLTEFPLPAGVGGPYDLASGIDGNLWFTRPDDDEIGFLTSTGSVSLLAIPTAASQPHGIISGPDGNIWFAESLPGQQGGQIGRLSIQPSLPHASAGPNQSVLANSMVTLDGSASTDPSGLLPLTYGWQQVGGAAVQLSNHTTGVISFTAPNAATVLTFTLTVTNAHGLASSPSGVVVTVLNTVPVISALSPITVTTGSASFTLVVTGVNFVGSTLFWNGSPRQTSLASTTELMALIPASDVAATGLMSVSVMNPAPGGGMSNQLFINVLDIPHPIRVFLPMVSSPT